MRRARRAQNRFVIERGRPLLGRMLIDFDGEAAITNHAYGLAVDVNPLENPYVGCGQSRDPATRPYFDRSRHRKGMVRPAVIRAFGSVGWGWGGAWTGDTKDYMHFPVNGH